MCKYFVKRSKKKVTYFYCRYLKKEIEIRECKECENKEYKKRKEIKKKSKKMKKLEKDRYSIITNDIKHCYLCGKQKQDTHELIGGCNRIKSIEWGLTIPLCRKCHSELENNQEQKEELQKMGQRKFEEKNGHELFMTEFKRNYLIETKEGKGFNERIN